jgi:type IV pilus assembly protein PilA
MKKNNKGFTLAELLIVVAIIAVLVAIAIPIFNSQLEKAREATDIANVRDIYAEVAVGLLDGTLVKNGDTMKVMNSLTATYDPSAKTVTVDSFPINQKVDGWQSATSISVAGVSVANPGVADKKSLVFTFATETNASGSENTYLSTITFN